MRKKIIFTSVLAGMFLIAGNVDAAGGNPKAGKVKSELCQGCHGPNGISVDPTTFPHLAGQFSGYIEKQITDFQKGKRNNDTMSPMAATIVSKEDLKDIAAYFSSQKQMKGKPEKSKLVQKGKDIFMNGNPRSGVYGCKNCHGEAGKGKSPNNSLFPVIGGQTKDYLIKQLKDFKAGKRVNDPAGMMGDIAKKLSDEEIKAVAEFVSTL
jgi:cytochrome c553